MLLREILKSKTQHEHLIKDKKKKSMFQLRQTGETEKNIASYNRQVMEGWMEKQTDMDDRQLKDDQ